LGFGFLIWSGAEVIDVAIWAEATDDMGARRRGQGQALGAGGDFAVVSDADAGLLTPDIRPPRAVWGGANDGAFFGQGLLVGGQRGTAQFAVDFLFISVRDQLVQELVGPGQFDDVIGCQE